MNLQDALKIQGGDVVAFVGAGGKTSALFRLADDLGSRGLRVILTTTTRIALDELALAPQVIQVDDTLPLPDDLAREIQQHPQVFLYTHLDEAAGKVKGVNPLWLDTELAPQDLLDVILVEADGARRLPLKAPYDHEPAIPASATLVIPVAGLDFLGQRLDETQVYGADQVISRLGIAKGSTITPGLVAAILGDPSLGLKAIPRLARAIPLLNKVSAETLPSARDIARRLLQNPRVAQVLLTTLREEDPLREARRRVSALILAAGESRRMGDAKLLLPWDGEKRIIRQVCEHVTASNFDEVILVTGRWHDEISRQLSDLPLTLVHNPAFAEKEMLASLKIGIPALASRSAAAMVILGDQPEITPGIFNRLSDAYAQTLSSIVAPAHKGKRGHPVLFDRSLWPDLLALPDEAAPRDLLRAKKDQTLTVTIDSPAILQDIDTPDDYRNARERRA